MNSSHQWRLEEHLPLIHDDLVGAGLWSPKEGDVFVLEGLQWLGFTSFVHWHVVSAHAQPQIVRKTSLFTLQRQRRHKRRKQGEEEVTRQVFTQTSEIHHFLCYFLTSTSNRVDPYPGHSLIMLIYLSMAWCWGMPCSRVHFSRTLVLVADVSSFTHISSICSSSTCSNTGQPINEEYSIKLPISQSDSDPVCWEVHLLFSKPDWFDWAYGNSAECRDLSRQTSQICKWSFTKDFLLKYWAHKMIYCCNIN